MNRIEVILFGLTGFGTELIQELLKYDLNIKKVYTRLNKYQFNYYNCETIEEICNKNNLPLIYIPENGDWEIGSADLGIVSSFHRIFKESHIFKLKKLINIHPSLLPSYKGATPTNWFIKNGGKVTGLTAHLITSDEIDSGEIIFQERILNPYLDDNKLRKILSEFSRIIIQKIVSSYPDYSIIKPEIQESSYNARTEADSILNIHEIISLEQLIFHIKAFTNFPKPKIKTDKGIFCIDFEYFQSFEEFKILNQVFHLPGYFIL